MNFRLTLVLLVVAVLAIAGFGVAQKQVPPVITPTPVVPPLLSLNVGNVVSLDVKTKDKETNVVKDTGKWKLVKPDLDTNVDQSKVDGVVGQLANLQGNGIVADASANLQPYGLTNPLVTASLQTGDGTTSVVLIGDATVNSNNYYAMKQGGPNVQLVPNSFVNDLVSLANNPPKATPTPVPTATTPPASASPSASS